MYKPFFLNHEYELEYTGNYLFRGKEVISDADTIDIEVGGSIITFDRMHACLFTHYRFNPFIVDMDNVWFAPVDSRVLGFHCNHLPVFKKPVEIGYGFRLVPGFHQFAINSDGIVISHRTGKALSVHINAYGYPSVSVFDPDKESWRAVVVHILLARAFIENPDPSNKVYVNHRDGNKLNLSLNNLEWVSPAENNMHAIETGLTDPRRPRECTVHDLVTGESKDYSSVTAALKALNITRGYYGKTRLVNGQVCPRVYAKRYIITDLGESPGVLSTSSGIATARTPNKGPYQALHTTTRKVLVADTLKEMAEMTGVPYDHVRAIIETPEPKTSHGYYFRIYTDGPWPDEFQELVSLKPRVFEIEHTETGETRRFESFKSLIKYLAVSKRTVERRLRDGRPYKGWSIREVS